MSFIQRSMRVEIYWNEFCTEICEGGDLLFIQRSVREETYLG